MTGTVDRDPLSQRLLEMLIACQFVQMVMRAFHSSDVHVDTVRSIVRALPRSSVANTYCLETFCYNCYDEWYQRQRMMSMSAHTTHSDRVTKRSLAASLFALYPRSSDRRASQRRQRALSQLEHHLMHGGQLECARAIHQFVHDILQLRDAPQLRRDRATLLTDLLMAASSTAAVDHGRRRPHLPPHKDDDDSSGDDDAHGADLPDGPHAVVGFVMPTFAGELLLRAWEHMVPMTTARALSPSSHRRVLFARWHSSQFRFASASADDLGGGLGRTRVEGGEARPWHSMFTLLPSLTLRDGGTALWAGARRIVWVVPVTLPTGATFWMHRISPRLSDMVEWLRSLAVASVATGPVRQDDRDDAAARMRRRRSMLLLVRGTPAAAVDASSSSSARTACTRLLSCAMRVVDPEQTCLTGLTLDFDGPHEASAVQVRKTVLDQALSRVVRTWSRVVPPGDRAFQLRCRWNLRGESPTPPAIQYEEHKRRLLSSAESLSGGRARDIVADAMRSRVCTVHEMRHEMRRSHGRARASDRGCPPLPFVLAQRAFCEYVTTSPFSERDLVSLVPRLLRREEDALVATARREHAAAVARVAASQARAAAVRGAQHALRARTLRALLAQNRTVRRTQRAAALTAVAVAHTAVHSVQGRIFSTAAGIVAAAAAQSAGASARAAMAVALEAVARRDAHLSRLYQTLIARAQKS